MIRAELCVGMSWTTMHVKSLVALVLAAAFVAGIGIGIDLMFLSPVLTVSDGSKSYKLRREGTLTLPTAITIKRLALAKGYNAQLFISDGHYSDVYGPVSAEIDSSGYIPGVNWLQTGIAKLVTKKA